MITNVEEVIKTTIELTQSDIDHIMEGEDIYYNIHSPIDGKNHEIHIYSCDAMKKEKRYD